MSITDTDIQELRTRLDGMEKEMERRKQLRKAERRWERSYWRLLLPPVAAYLVMASFYHWVLDVDDSWTRALGTVLAFVTYTAVRSFYRGWNTFRGRRDEEM